jgi:hypothetical protein
MTPLLLKLPRALAHDPAPVGVREEDVVEVGDQPHRHLELAVGSGSPGQIEELASGLVTERLQPWAQALEYRTHREA